MLRAVVIVLLLVLLWVAIRPAEHLYGTTNRRNSTPEDTDGRDAELRNANELAYFRKMQELQALRSS